MQNKNEAPGSKIFKNFKMMIVEDLIKHRAILSWGGGGRVTTGRGPHHGCIELPKPGKRFLFN